MEYLNSTAGLKPGDKVGVAVYNSTGMRFAIKEIVRVSSSGSIWLADSSTPFKKNGVRKTDKWRHDRLLSAAHAEEVIKAQRVKFVADLRLLADNIERRDTEAVRKQSEEK